MTFAGTCQVGQMIDGETCNETQVVEIRVHQRDNAEPEVLGTLCLSHAAVWKRLAFPTEKES